MILLYFTVQKLYLSAGRACSVLPPPSYFVHLLTFRIRILVPFILPSPERSWWVTAHATGKAYTEPPAKATGWSRGGWSVSFRAWYVCVRASCRTASRPQLPGRHPRRTPSFRGTYCCEPVNASASSGLWWLFVCLYCSSGCLFTGGGIWWVPWAFVAF